LSSFVGYIGCAESAGNAYKDVSRDVERIEEEDIKDLVFLGLQGMIDPPGKELLKLYNDVGLQVSGS